MINDKLLKVADAQASAFAQGTTVSTSSIDLQSARDVGEGEPMYMLFSVDTAVTSAGAATVRFDIITTDNADLTGNVKILASTAAIPKATLVAGYYTALRIPPNIGTKGQRYLGASFTIGTADLTAGAFTAQIVKDIEDAKGKEYPSGFTVA